jgi:hypothetical protein
MMSSRIARSLAMLFLFFAPATGRAASQYIVMSKDFETLSPTDPSALAGDGLQAFANVYSPDHSTLLYSYSLLAPNNAGGFCGVEVIPDTPGHGVQDLLVFSDYNNGDQPNGRQIESMVFWPLYFGSAASGPMPFRFDARRGDLTPPSSACAFIGVIENTGPYSGDWVVRQIATLDLSSIPTTFDTYTIPFSLPPSLLPGYVVFGFANTAANHAASGMSYDNISIGDELSPARASSWGRLKSLYR